MDALGFFFSQPVLKKPLRNLLFKLSLFAFHCPGFTLEQGTPEAQSLISITGTSKLLRVFTNLLQKCWEGPHQDKLMWKLNNDNYLMAGPIFWTLLFIFCPFSKTGKKSWAEQHKNKQQNSSLQPQPTSPMIWEKYSLPHICPCRLPSLIYCREKNYSGTVWVNRGLMKSMRMTNVTPFPRWTPRGGVCRQLKPIHQQMQQHLFPKHLLCINMQITPRDSDLKASCFCCCCFKELEPATAQSHFSFGFWLLLQYSLNIQILTREGYPKEYF